MSAERRSRKLKVAVVAPSMRILGGQAVQARQLLDAWQNDPAVEAWLVPINPEPPKALSFLTRIKYVRTLVTTALYLPLLLRELRRADVVHVFSASYASFLLAPLPAIAVAKLLHRPVLLNYHSGEAPDHLKRSRIARTVLARVDRLVVQSSFLQEVFASFGLAAAVVPNTIDTRRFEFRDRPSFAPNLISTRNLEPTYNVGCTLRAFQRVQDRFPHARLSVVGFGREEQQLRALASTLGLRHVTFTGRVAPEDIAAKYADADIYVQTPNLDNMPLSVLEAFACGLPVVSTRAGGVPAMLRDGQDGLLAPVGDHEAVASHIIRLLDDQALAKRVAAAARERVSAYEWPVVREQWLAEYAATCRHPQSNAHPATRPGERQRVVVFMTNFDPGGTERQTIELIRRLGRDRIEVHVACLHRTGAWRERVEAAAESVAEFPIRGFLRPGTLSQLLRFASWVRRIRPSVLHCTDFYTNIFGLPGGMLAGVPLRIGSRRDINPGRSRPMLLAQRLSYAFAHVVVANSCAAADRCARERVPQRKLRVIRNGFDFSTTPPRAIRGSLSRIAVVANLRPEKAHAVLLDALPALLRVHPDVTVAVVGDGSERAALAARAEARGVSHAVRFEGHCEDVLARLAEADIFVLPSRSEASPNAVIEAMAMGLPVVACAVGGNVEVVRDGATGLLVPPDDPTALGRAISTLIDNPARAHAMGLAARESVLARYGMARMVSEFEEIYRSRTPAPVSDARPELVA